MTILTNNNWNLVSIYLKRVQKTKTSICKKVCDAHKHLEHNNDELHEAEPFCRSLTSKLLEQFVFVSFKEWWHIQKQK